MSRLLLFSFIFFANLHYVSAAPAVGSLCFVDEAVVFSCRATDGKTISLCSSSTLTASEGYLQYRFGKIGGIPGFIYPKIPEHPWEHFLSGAVAYSGGSASYLKFSRGDYIYTVFTGIGEGWEKAGVVVNKMGKVYSYLPCNGPLISELGPVLFEDIGLAKDPHVLDFMIP